MMNIKSAITIASALVSAVAIADKAIKRSDEEKTAVRRGYKEVHASSMACEGLKLGEFCVSNSDLCIHILPNDRTSNTVITSIYISDRISNVDCDLECGFYTVNVGGKIRRCFFDGNNFLILSKCNAVRVNRKIDLETYDMVNELHDLRKQLDHTKKLETELSEMRKKLEQLEQLKKQPAKGDKADKAEK